MTQYGSAKLGHYHTRDCRSEDCRKASVEQGRCGEMERGGVGGGFGGEEEDTVDKAGWIERGWVVGRSGGGEGGVGGGGSGVGGGNFTTNRLETQQAHERPPINWNGVYMHVHTLTAATHTHTPTHTHTHTQTHARARARTHTRTHTRTHIHTHARTNADTHTHTHTHTPHTQSLIHS